MINKLILFISVALSVQSFAADKTKCSNKELLGHDCHLQIGALGMDLLDKTIAWNDGTWQSVDPMPLSGEGISWEKLTLSRIGPNIFLQMWLWDKAVGEMQVQSQHWYVTTLQKRKTHILGDGIVRKRHLEQPLLAASGTAPAPKPKYLNDALEKHEFRHVKGNEFVWILGGQSKAILLEP